MVVSSIAGVNLHIHRAALGTSKIKVGNDYPDCWISKWVFLLKTGRESGPLGTHRG